MAAWRSGNQACMKLRCGNAAVSWSSRGMEAQIVDDEDDPEMDAYVVCYCPSCAQREFGESKPRHRGQDR